MAHPSPDISGASHGDTERHPIGLVHLICHCQLHEARRMALCGLDVSDLPRDRDPFADPETLCAVCRDLARTVIVARRCERCA
jgi:hypothetical protein